MARRRPGLVAARRVAAGGLLFVGLFVACFGVGSLQRSWVVTGAALMVAALAARVTTNFRRTPRQWVSGTGHVLEVSDPPRDSRYGRCSMRLTLEVSGLPGATVTVHEPRVLTSQWPAPGHRLPVQVAGDDPRNVRVMWRSYDPATAEPAGSDPAEEWAGQPEPDRVEPEPAGEPLWDDQPQPAPAAPPGSHRDRPAETDIDFELDGPPTVPIPRPPGAAEVSAGDEGRVSRDVPLARDVPPGGGAPAGERHPARPSPRPRRPPAPVAAASRAGVAADAAPATGRAVADLVTTYPSAHPGPAGAIHGVGITVLVADLARSVAFYRDQLGFYEVDGGEGNLVLASGETRLVLRQAPEVGTVDRRLVHLNFEVADIDAMYEELKAAGVRFTYPPRVANRSARLELWAAAFRDPDGHGVAITQWRPRRDPAPEGTPEDAA